METVRRRPRAAPDTSPAAGRGHGRATPPREPTVSVIVPALNEARNLPHVLDRMPPVHEVILVDGGSVDDTVAVARGVLPDIRVVQQDRSGKGNALACGFAAASGSIIVMIDADGSTDPAEIPDLVAALRAGADLATGSRFLSTGSGTDLAPIRRLGNRALNLLVNVLFGTGYSDLCYGYHAFWVRCLPVFGLGTAPPGPGEARLPTDDGLELAALLNLRAARAGLNVAEVASFAHGPVPGLSNLDATKDGIRVLRTIAGEWRRRGGQVPAYPDASGPVPAGHRSPAAAPAPSARPARRIP